MRLPGAIWAGLLEVRILSSMDDLTPRLDAIKAKFEHVKEYL